MFRIPVIDESEFNEEAYIGDMVDFAETPIEFEINPDLKVQLPYVTLKSPILEIKRAIPLKILKKLIDRNFEGWIKTVEEIIEFSKRV